MLGGPGLRPALAHDPGLVWWTITTPHFNIHYPQGTQGLAKRVAGIAEDALFLVSEQLEHIPAGRIELVIVDDSDSANGSATPLPYNQIIVFASAPDDLSELNDFDDYLRILLLHELVHIVHVDTTHGLPRWINAVFGRTAFPNGAQPQWFTEGLAVQLESALTSAGRIRSSLFRMYLRTAALSGTIPALDQLSGGIRAWPQGGAPYLYGGFFMQFLVERYGQEVLSDLSHQMAGMIIPWSLNVLARREMGQDYSELYDRWLEHETRSAQALLTSITAQGLTPFRQLTRAGQHQRQPRVSGGSSQILYFSAPADDWPSLRLVGTDGQGDRLLCRVNSEGGAAFSPDGRRVVFSQAEVYAQFHVYSDLWSSDLVSGKIERLTRGERARTPDISPDGRQVVFVQNESGRTRLRLLDLHTGASATILEGDHGRQLYTPRFSPDGRLVVYSVSGGSGTRHLEWIRLADGSVTRLTRAPAMDLDPVFDVIGHGLLFASDRTGIYNLYRLDLDSGEIRRLTNLASGAFSPEPTPDGRGIVFMVYGPAGYDIAWIDRPAGDYPAGIQRPARPPAAPVEDEPEMATSPYRPGWSLLPRSWFPVWGEDGASTTYGILFGGSDALGKLSYSVNLTVGPETRRLHYDLGLTAQVLYPSLTVYTARRVERLRWAAAVNDIPWTVDRRRTSLYVDLSFPFSTVRRYQSIFIDYDLQWFDTLTAIPRDPLGYSPVLPDDRSLAWIGIGWYGSQLERYLQSISTELGLAASVSLRYSHPALGSGSRLAEARLWLRGFMPLIKSLSHVLAFGLQAGVAIGDESRRGLFAVGGLPLRDPLPDTYFGYNYSGLYLRGYPPGSIVGSAYLLGSLEYRLPIVRVERGIFTLPFFVRDLHAGLFIDFGGASPEPSLDKFVDDLLRVGIGAELRLELQLAYYLPFTIRFGYGRGLMSGGTNNWYLVLGNGF